MRTPEAREQRRAAPLVGLLPLVGDDRRDLRQVGVGDRDAGDVVGCGTSPGAGPDAGGGGATVGAGESARAPRGGPM